MTKREQIVRLLQKQPEPLPDGALSAVARKVGCSRAYVHAVAVGAGIVGARVERSLMVRKRTAETVIPDGVSSAEVFAANVKRRRLLAGYSQLALAAKVGTTVTTIARIERGERGASSRMQDRLAVALGVSVAALMRA